MMKQLRVFLTGASGFIGSHVARQLLSDGTQVMALLRPGARRSPRIADIINQLEIIEGDLASIEGLRSEIARFAPRVCIHLAWHTEPGEYLESQINLDQLTGSINLLKTLSECDCPRFCIAGTSFEYDTDAGNLSERSPIRPRTLYAATKHALGLIAEQMVKAHGATLAVPRIFYVYGPHEHARRMVPFVIRRLLANEACQLTSGEQVRDYLHVEDVASAICRTAQSNIEGAINIGSSEPVTVRAVAEEIGRQMNRAHLLRFGALPSKAGDPPFVCADASRLRFEIGWQPHYTLETGLCQTIEWWRAQDGLSV